MNEKKGNWYLLTGILLGMVVGLLYAWVIDPVKYTNASPASLSSSGKDNYRLVIAEAYAADGDLGRAQSRLALLGDADSVHALAQQAQEILAANGSQANASLLVNLASAIEGKNGSATSTSLALAASPTPDAITQAPTATVYLPSDTATQVSRPTLTPTPGITRVVFTPTSTLTPSATPDLSRTAVSPTMGTQADTLTPTATHGAPFTLKNRSQVCDQTSANPVLGLQVNDASGNPVPGVKIQITWQGGQNSFYTGLMPEVNSGYASFVMAIDVAYTIQLTDGGKPITDLKAVQCTASGSQNYWGGWYLVLQQP